MRSYIEVPIGIGLIPCDTLIEDRITGKKTIVGVIGAIRVSHFPCIYPSFHLLVSLTGGNGVYPCLLQVVSESKDEVVFSETGNLPSGSPTRWWTWSSFCAISNSTTRIPTGSSSLWMANPS